MTKVKIIEDLNKEDNPKSFGFELCGDDGQNQYWHRKFGNIRLNRSELDNGYVWDNDVSGWEI